MATHPAEQDIHEEDLESAEDSDFAPEPVSKDIHSDSSDSESEADDEDNLDDKPRRQKATKRKRGVDDFAQDIGIENSGDEAIVSKGLKKRRKKGAAHEDDEGGEGGLIKTRRMRALEKVEAKPLATTEAATVDVDALWQSMANGSLAAPMSTNDIETNQRHGSTTTRESTALKADHSAPRDPSTADDADANEMIMIKRTYNFAGKIHEEEKLVSRHSAEGKLWLLQSQASGSAAQPSSESSQPTAQLLRPARRLRRSAFEPVVSEPLPPRTDLHFGNGNGNGNGYRHRHDDSRAQQLLARGLAPDAKRLNTVQKSKMDWAGFVDKEGIKDELEVAGRKKGGFMEQQDFLARVEQKKEEDARRARMKKLAG